MKAQLIRYRRPLAALFAVVAVVLVRLPPQTGTSGAPVLVAAGDLPGGAPLTLREVRTVRLHPPPAGALTRLPDGAVLAAPVRQGEPLTDLRLLSPALLDAYGPGLVAAPVRIADPALASLVHPGDRVDVLATSSDLSPSLPGSSLPGSFSSGPLVTAAPVLSAPPAASSSGVLLLLAVTRGEATALARTPHLTISLCPPATPGNAS